jgi:hypothetical protein
MERGGQIGNQNAARGKIWNDHLRRAIIQDDFRRVRQAAEKLLDLAAQGEPWAIKELGDRLDGKAIQATTLEDASGNTILPHLQVTFVKPDE